MPYIDLHSHTTYSDGTSTVTNSLNQAELANLSFFSVSDHNMVDAYDEIMEKRHLFSGKILPAVELSTTWNGEAIEILGYGIDIPLMKKLISENYKSFYDKQVAEAKLDTDVMLSYGVRLGEEFVEAMREQPWSIFDPNHSTNRPYLLAEIQRYPENARFFASQNEFETIDEQHFMRDYIFNPDSTLYSDLSSFSPSVSKVIHMIHETGGLAFLAHTFSYSSKIVYDLDQIVKAGLDGIECHYGTFTREQKEYLYNYCEEKGLYKSGGSDFHGIDMRPKNILGVSAGERIELSLVEPWIARMNTL